MRDIACWHVHSHSEETSRAFSASGSDPSVTCKRCAAAVQSSIKKAGLVADHPGTSGWKTLHFSCPLPRRLRFLARAAAASRSMSGRTPRLVRRTLVGFRGDTPGLAHPRNSRRRKDCARRFVPTSWAIVRQLEFCHRTQNRESTATRTVVIINRHYRRLP